MLTHMQQHMLADTNMEKLLLDTETENKNMDKNQTVVWNNNSTLPTMISMYQ